MLLAFAGGDARAEPPDAPNAREIEQAPSAPAELTPLADPLRIDPSAAWRPPVHDPTAKRERDWLLLSSGELLEGEIEYIRDEKVHFDSDELEDLDIDWDDVAGFGSPRLNTYRLGDEIIVTGTAGMRGGVIRIDTGTQILEFARGDLFSMIEGEQRELNYWSLKGALGLLLRSGNSDQTDLSTRVQLKRETPLTRATLLYESAYSTVENEDITDNARVAGLFGYNVTTRGFLVAPFGELYRDRIRNVDLRGTVGAGAGYDFVKRPKAKWTVVGGGGYQRTDYSRVATTESRTGEDGALLFYTTLELDPFKDVDWDTSYQLVAVVSDWNRTSHHLTSVLSFEVWGPLDLDVSFVWDRIEKPAEDPDGKTPKSDDLQLKLEIAIDL